MRLRITFRPLGKRALDMDYYEQLSMIFNKYYSEHSDDFHSLHNECYNSENMAFNLFTFSQLFCSEYDLEGSYIILKNLVRWYISSPINEVVLGFAQYIIEQKKLKLGELELEFLGIEPIRTPEFSDYMIFRCLSPICVSNPNPNSKNHNGFLSMESENFNRQIKNNLIRKYHFLTNKLPQDMTLDIKVLNFNEGCSETNICVKSNIIKCYSPVFQVCGNKELISLGYEAGFGSQNNMGLGMVEIY